MAHHRSPRVNKALMANHSGQTVRLIAKLITFKDDMATVEASDRGELDVKLLPDFNHRSTYLEVIGKVMNDKTIKMEQYLNMGDDIDMKFADQAVRIWHDARFTAVF
ncbi:replication factor A protein 3 [Ganoderma leucocontextum]|nr:replication factor A protein 3 [Ganoderma leucocontextum]